MKKILIPALLLMSTFTFGQDKLGFTRHNHVALHVKDIQVSAKFYQEIVGMKPIPVPESLKGRRFWFDVGDGQQVHLLDGRTETIIHDRNGSHIALFVESMEKAEAFLKKQNIPYHKQVRVDGVPQIYFSDPDGYLLEINADNHPKAN